MNPTQTPRRLARSRDDRWIAGVCGGLGRYFNLDPVIIRLAAVALTFAGGAGVIAYAGAWLLVPEEGSDTPLLKGSTNNRKLATIAGIALVVLGAISLLSALHLWFDGGVFWALFALGAGGFLLLRYTDLGKRFGVTPHTATAGGAPPAAPPPPAPAPPRAPSPPRAPTSTALVPTSPAASPALPGDTAPTEPTEPLEPFEPPTEPLGAAPSPIDDLPPNDPALIEERRERRRRRRRTTFVAFGVLLVALGVAGTLVAAGVVDVGTQTFLAGAVVATGVTVVVASFYGGAPALLWVGLLLAAGVGVVAAADIPLDKGVGDRVYRPATATAIKPKYELGVGRLWIDMRDARLPQGTTNVHAEIGIGELDVVVPEGTRVVARGQADVGDVRILAREDNGTDVDKRVVEPLRRNGELVPRTVRIDGKVGIGAINVYRGADAPQPGDGDSASTGSFGGGFASIGALR
jgi:phage shock protein PspC (stress-responsive transcriptional regulator)